MEESVERQLSRDRSVSRKHHSSKRVAETTGDVIKPAASLPLMTEALLSQCAAQQLQIDQCKSLIRQQEMTLVKLRHQVLRGLSRSQSDTDSSQELLDEKQRVLEEEIKKIVREQNKSIIKLRQDSIRELTDLSPQAGETSLVFPNSPGWVENGTFPRIHKGKGDGKTTYTKSGQVSVRSQGRNYPLDKSQSHDTCMIGVTGTPTLSSSKNYPDHVYQNALDMRKPQRPLAKPQRKKPVQPDSGGFSFQKYYSMYKTGTSSKTLHQRLRLGSYSADDILSANENDHKTNKQEGLRIIHKPWSSLDNTSQRKTYQLEDFGDYVSLTSVDSAGLQRKSILSHGSYAKKIVNWDSSSFNSSDDSPFTSCELPTTTAGAERPLASSSPKVSFSATETVYFTNSNNSVGHKLKLPDCQPNVEYANVIPKSKRLAKEPEQSDYDVPKSTKTVAEPSASTPAHLWLQKQTEDSTPKRPDSLDIRKQLSLKVVNNLNNADSELSRHGSLKERLNHQPVINDSLCSGSDPQLARERLTGKAKHQSCSVKQKPSYEGWTRVERSPSKINQPVKQVATPQHVPYQGWTRVSSERRTEASATVKDPMFEFPTSKTEQTKCQLDRDDACSNCRMSTNQRCYFCRHKPCNVTRLSRRVSDPNLRMGCKYKIPKMPSRAEKDVASSEEETSMAMSNELNHKRSKSYDHVHAKRIGADLRDSFRKQIVERTLTERPRFAHQNAMEKAPDEEDDFDYVDAAEDVIETLAKEDKLHQLRQDLAELTNIEEEMKSQAVAAPPPRKPRQANQEDHTTTAHKSHSINLFSNDSRATSTKDNGKSRDGSVKPSKQTSSSSGSTKSSSGQLSPVKKMKLCVLM